MKIRNSSVIAIIQNINTPNLKPIAISWMPKATYLFDL